MKNPTDQFDTTGAATEPNPFDQFVTTAPAEEPNPFEQFIPKSPSVGARYDLPAAKTVELPDVAQTAREVYDWAQTVPDVMRRELEKTDKALAESSPGTAAYYGAMADAFISEAFSQFTTPLGVATLAAGPAARVVGAAAPALLPAAKAGAGIIQVAAALPAAEMAGAALGEASVDPSLANIGKAAGAVGLAALGAVGGISDLRGVKPAAEANVLRERNVVSDADWSRIRDRVINVQSAEAAQAEARQLASGAQFLELPTGEQPVLPSGSPEGQPQLPSNLPEGQPLLTAAPGGGEGVQTVLPSGKTIRMPLQETLPSGEVIRVPEPIVGRSVEAQIAETNAFNAKVKRVMETMNAAGVKLSRKQAAEMARMEPREYSLTRQALIDAVQPPEEPGAVEIKPTRLTSLEQLTPEMAGIPPEPVVEPKKTGVITTEVPVVTPAEKAAGLGQPAIPTSRRMMELERPMYDSGLVDEMGNTVWVDEQGRAIDRRTYQDPREVIRTPAEKVVYDNQLAERVQYEKLAEANERVDNVAQGEAVIVSTPDTPTPIPATFVGKSASGRSVIATPQGQAEVPNTAIVSAENASMAKVISPPIVTKVKDPTIGGWDVKIGENQYRIFRDPEDKWWYLDASGHHSGRVLSTENKAAAIRELVQNEDKWIAQIAKEETRLVRSKQQVVKSKLAKERIAYLDEQLAAKEITPAEHKQLVAEAKAQITAKPEAVSEPMPGLESKTEKIQVALSASPPSSQAQVLPGLIKLAKESQTDPQAARLLSDIAADSLRYLFRDIEAAKVEYTPTIGLYGGELEGSLGVALTFPAAEKAKLMSRLTMFAKNFGQEQIHVRGDIEAGTRLAHKYADGSYNTIVATWDAKKLSRAQIEKLAKESGLYGFTVSDNKLLAYYVGDPTDVAQINQFRKSVNGVSKSLGKTVPRVERLWIYGRDAIPFPRVEGFIPKATTELNATAQRVAARLASREVVPVQQAKELTKPQAELQTRLAKAYEKMRMNALETDWRVKRAYTELADEVLQQFDAIPVKVEILSGKGEPYKNSRDMRSDVLGNNHLYIYGTDAKTFGPEGISYENHPLLQDSGRVDINGKPLLYNDLLRAVHDYYAHTMSPVQFGVLGEEAAWRNHMAMTRSPWARLALTSETRAQNSYVNFGPDAAWNKANPGQTKFAPQKTDIPPLEFAKTGDPKLDAEIDAIGNMKPPIYERQRVKRVSSKKERGAVNLGLLSYMGQTAFGATSGFVYGYNKDPNASLEERVSNGLQWALFGAAVGNPTVRNALIRGVYNAKIPVKYFGPKFKKAMGGMDNFVIFTKSALGEVYDVIKNERPEAMALTERVTRDLDALESMRGKVTATDWYSAMQGISNRGNFNLVVDPKLRAAAMNVRSSIDDFTLDMIGMGIVQPGTDLEFTMMLNQGKYLTRTYEIFTNPEFQYDPVKQEAAIAQYVAQMQLNGSPKTVAELRQEGLETTLFQLAKVKGTALAPNAHTFAMGNGIARVDGSILKPRRELDLAWREMLGEITDPVRVATLTVDRMANIIAASITQSKMAEVGLQTGLFTRNATATHTVPLINVDGDLAYGPLNKLWTTPEVRDGLYTMRSYSGNSLPFRTLATVSGAMKIGKTVLHPISYAPNFLSALMQPMTQGLTYRVITNPKGVRDAYSVVFGKSFPSNTAQIAADIPLLIKGGLLKQNVNLNDLVETARASFVPSATNRMVTWVPESARKSAKNLLNGALSIYGKAEEFPRLVAFYAELERYSNVFFGKPSDQLTIPERVVAFERALSVSRDVYPNSQAVPEVVKKLSVGGILEPFVAYKWETLFRTPYNTIRRGLDDIREGQQTRNTRQIIAGIARISSLIGAVYGAYAINEAYNKKKGVSGPQDKSIRNILPKWDKTGMLVITDLTPDEIAYANQSYIMPQSIVTAAFKAGLDGMTPVEAAALFLRETAGSMVSDGGLLIKPVMEAVTGTNEFGRRIYPRDGGQFFDVSGIQSSALQDAATKGQNLVAGTLHALRNLSPGFTSESMKWYKMAKEEVGPDGQVYKVGDLAARLGGIRINRIDIPLQFERKAGELFGRFNEASTEFGRARNRKDATPESIETAYQMMEQSRKIIWRDTIEYLRDGENLNQPKDKMLKNLRESGLPSDFLLGVMNGFYVPGKKINAMSAREQFQILMSQNQRGFDEMWANIVANNPTMAKAMRPMFREVGMGRTEEDRMILSMDDNDGTRARTIAQILLKIPDLAQRQLKLQDMSNRGLIRGQTAVQLYEDPVQAAKTWAEAKVRLQMNQPPMPPREPDSTAPTQPGATMKASPSLTPAPPIVLPPAPKPTPLGKFREGGLYRDPTAGNLMRYQNGQFVPVNP